MSASIDAVASGGKVVLVKRPKDGLGVDHEDVPVASHSACCAKDVSELLSVHDDSGSGGAARGTGGGQHCPSVGMGEDARERAAGTQVDEVLSLPEQTS